VLLSAGSEYGPGGGQRVRFCFAADRTDVQAAVERIAHWAASGWAAAESTPVGTGVPGR
jgi:aspartate/methionine/tyrosine aminotransferase